MAFKHWIKDFFAKEEKDPYSKTKEEKIREFYLDPGKSYQYIPKARLVFQNSYLPIYKYRGVTFKSLYLAKVPLPTLALLGVVYGNAFGDMGLMIFVTGVSSFALAALHSIFYCRVGKEIHLHEDGDKVDVVYTLLNLYEVRKTHFIQEFSNKTQSPIMWMWSLNPVPKNILLGIETDFSELLPIYVRKKFGFYLFHGRPEIGHQDLLVNVMNGVIIDTKAFQGRVNYFKDRYRVLK